MGILQKLQEEARRQRAEKALNENRKTLLDHIKEKEEERNERKRHEENQRNNG
ncbi:MAG: hypothetical protein GX428_09705 [Candidatus Atribacteria bacterium]|nr:hypothetical protein [Candidatus Atribacteria bacterium]